MNPLPYPWNLLIERPRIRPLFGSRLEGNPHVFDFSSRNPANAQRDTRVSDEFQKSVFDELKASGLAWGIGRYLEERASLLRAYPQIVDEGRVYHLGLDVVVPAGLKLFAPLDAMVHEVGREEGIGNYGGYAILRHDGFGEPFYSFYGHLVTPHPIQVGQKVSAGDCFGTIGEPGPDSGYWFTHTHLQILTQKAVDAGRTLQGYAKAEWFPTLDQWFPSPYYLFRM
jgi:murein DD-endopeptidase MepM/ murein hydrolase activator NlpD